MYQEKETCACAPVAPLSRGAASFPRAVCAGSAKVAPSLPGKVPSPERLSRVASPGGGLYAGRKSVQKKLKVVLSLGCAPGRRPHPANVGGNKAAKRLLFGAEKPRPPLRSTPLRRNGAGEPFAWVPLRLCRSGAFRPSGRWPNLRLFFYALLLTPRARGRVNKLYKCLRRTLVQHCKPVVGYVRVYQRLHG
jgi:hypothetical protein